MNTRPKQIFLQRRYTDGQRACEKCSTSLNTREINIKITRRYHLISVRMNIIKESTNNKCQRWCGKGSLPHSWWEYKLMQPLWRTTGRFLKILKVGLPYDLTIFLLGIHLEENIILKDTCTSMLIAALFIIAKIWRQTKCSLTDEWINKVGYIFIEYDWNITQP